MPGHLILDNVRILDFGWVLAGPYATRILADFGAEVIKVQPPFSQGQDKFSLGYFNNWNRNKLGVSLNLQKPQGIEIAKKLVSISDVVLENFSPRVMENWRLDYPELKKIKPDIIFLSMSTMGHSGHWKDFSGFGPTVQAFSGITNLTTYPDQPPLGLGHSYANHIAALYACLSLLGALEFRYKTGKGQYIDLSQTETMASLLSDSILDFAQKSHQVKPVGNCLDLSAPCGVFRCLGEDKWCAISISCDEEWQGFKSALGNPLWGDDERFTSHAKRLDNIEALNIFVQEWTQHHSDQDVMTSLQKEGVPAGKVQNSHDLANDPQLKARKFLIQLDHPELGNRMTDASPIHLSNNPAAYKKASPIDGEDNSYVYHELLGFSRDEIDKLLKDKVI
jgi:benzylsuccinate CoA-transferase BbsF subunit